MRIYCCQHNYNANQQRKRATQILTVNFHLYLHDMYIVDTPSEKASRVLVNIPSIYVEISVWNNCKLLNEEFDPHCGWISLAEYPF